MSTNEVEERVRKKRLSQMRRTTFARHALREELNRKERERYWGNEEVRKRKRAGAKKDLLNPKFDPRWVHQIQKKMEDLDSILYEFAMGGRGGSVKGGTITTLVQHGPVNSKKYYQHLINTGVIPPPSRLGGIVIRTPKSISQRKPSYFYSKRDIIAIFNFFISLIKNNRKSNAEDAVEEIIKLNLTIQGN